MVEVSCPPWWQLVGSVDTMRDRQEHALEPGNHPVEIDSEAEDACNALTDVSLVPV